MTPSQRLVLNTIATYSRSVIGVALMLFSSRWVLNSLGPSDFGLFNVVGSIIIFITLLNNVMAVSVARYYAFSIGQSKPNEVTHWFNSALSMHLCLAVILVIIGWPIGEYAIARVLTVPEDRIVTCLWVFRVSLVSAFVSMTSIPCVAMFTAQQRIVETAFWGIIRTMLVFFLAFCLTHMTGDLLLIYAVGMVSIIVFIQGVMTLRAFIIFKECQIAFSHWFDGERFKKIFSFAIWNLVGSMGVTLRDQGSAILLNIYFGPSVNSSYGIATQVSTQANQLSAAMLGAFGPEITACEGRGDRQRMLTLAKRASKFGTILVLLFAVPLIMEIDYVLKLWLKEPPLYTGTFCRLILTAFLIDRLSSGFMLAVNARGRIAVYQATLGTTLLLTLPLAWLLLKIGCVPTSVGIAFVITIVVCSFGRVLWGRYLFGVPIRLWLTAVVFRCGFVACAATLTSMACRLSFPPSFARLIITVGTSVTVSLMTTWFFAFDVEEREFAWRNTKCLLGKMGGKWKKCNEDRVLPEKETFGVK